jgi:hypothetical protein
MVRNDRDIIWSLGKVARTVVPNPEFAFYGETAAVPLHQTGRQPSADTHYPTGVRAYGVERREPFQDGRQPLGGDAHAGVVDNHRQPVGCLDC